MKLTEKHERHLARYLQEVEDGLQGMPERTRRRTVAQLRETIENDLKAITKDVPHDKDIEAVLVRIGTPATAAARLLNGGVTAATKPQSTNTVWLGVCRELAEKAGVEPIIIRAIAVVLCVLFYPAPLVLLAYIATYLGSYYSDRTDATEPLDWFGIIKRVCVALGTGILLYAGTRVAIWFMYWAPTRLITGPRPVVNPSWGWIEHDNGWYFFWSLAIAVPLAFIAGLPVREDWRGTLQKLYQLVLALYGVVISFGIASLIVGLIFVYVKQFTGVDIMTTLRELTSS